MDDITEHVSIETNKSADWEGFEFIGSENEAAGKESKDDNVEEPIDGEGDENQYILEKDQDLDLEMNAITEHVSMITTKSSDWKVVYLSNDEQEDAVQESTNESVNMAKDREGHENENNSEKDEDHYPEKGDMTEHVSSETAKSVEQEGDEFSRNEVEIARQESKNENVEKGDDWEGCDKTEHVSIETIKSAEWEAVEFSGNEKEAARREFTDENIEKTKESDDDEIDYKSEIEEYHYSEIHDNTEHISMESTKSTDWKGVGIIGNYNGVAGEELINENVKDAGDEEGVKNDYNSEEDEDHKTGIFDITEKVLMEPTKSAIQKRVKFSENEKEDPCNESSEVVSMETTKSAEQEIVAGKKSTNENVEEAESDEFFSSGTIQSTDQEIVEGKETANVNVEELKN
ncbi:unnamed protein product, partial [Owenia fusiformis]